MNFICNVSGQSKKLLLTFLFFIGVIFSKVSFAVDNPDNCGFTNTMGWGLSTSLPVIGNGLSTVGEDLPVGATIYSNALFGSGIGGGNSVNAIYECQNDIVNIESGAGASTEKGKSVNVTFFRRIDAVSLPSGAPVISGGKAIYPTNIPGIGVTFEIWALRNATSFPDTWEESFVSGGNGNLRTYAGVSKIAFTLVKTGAIDKTVGIQQISASSFPVFQVVYGTTVPVAEENILTTISFTGDIIFHTRTCQLATPNIDVALGEHQVSHFKAVGTVTEWKDFDITLKDCPPFYGYGIYENYSGIMYNETELNKVSLSFTSANGSVESNPLLAKIDSSPDSAQGIGIELSQRDESTSINMDGTGTFDLGNLTTVDNATYNIPLKARYVQYDETVKGGLANGAVVFTITYQ